MEDCAKWFSRFYKEDKTIARVNIAYEFDKGFAPTIPLPFPLVASNEVLSGLKVSGLSFQFPEDDPFETAILQREKDGIYLFLQKTAVLKLRDFDPFIELKELAATVRSFVTREKNNGANKPKTKARKKP